MSFFARPSVFVRSRPRDDDDVDVVAAAVVPSKAKSNKSKRVSVREEASETENETFARTRASIHAHARTRARTRTIRQTHAQAHCCQTSIWGVCDCAGDSRGAGKDAVVCIAAKVPLAFDQAIVLTHGVLEFNADPLALRKLCGANVAHYADILPLHNHFAPKLKLDKSQEGGEGPDAKPRVVSE